MLATRWQPVSGVWSEVGRIQDEMERLFGRWGLNGPRRLNRALFPPVNVWEDGENLYVEAELPGMELDDLEIYVNGENQLTIQGSRQQPELDQGNWHRQERGCGAFARMLELPQEVASQQVTAALKQGVLTITLPKKEDAKPRRIEVRAS